jgi:hypothetical protein
VRTYREPVITGGHVIVYSNDAGADRAFLRDVLGYPFVDEGGGWLIFELPPAEVADQRWGLVTRIRLPGGGELGLYEPRHPRATQL